MGPDYVNRAARRAREEKQATVFVPRVAPNATDGARSSALSTVHAQPAESEDFPFAAREADKMRAALRPPRPRMADARAADGHELPWTALLARSVQDMDHFDPIAIRFGRRWGSCHASDAEFP